MDGYVEMGTFSSQFYPDWFDLPEGKEGAASFSEKRPPRFWNLRRKAADAQQALIDDYEETGGE
jgi:naphthoate synthase/2-ketocyclohexanecarboxyl-CoA hydrolase